MNVFKNMKDSFELLEFDRRAEKSHGPGRRWSPGALLLSYIRTPRTAHHNAHVHAPRQLTFL